MSCGKCHRCGLDLAWLWLWLAAAALIQALAWELPYTSVAALKRKRKRKKKFETVVTMRVWVSEIILEMETHFWQICGQIIISHADFFPPFSPSTVYFYAYRGIDQP